MCAVFLFSVAADGTERDYAFTLTDGSLCKKRGLSGEWLEGEAMQLCGA
jgi:hypothetical protein